MSELTRLYRRHECGKRLRRSWAVYDGDGAAELVVERYRADDELDIKLVLHRGCYEEEPGAQPCDLTRTGICRADLGYMAGENIWSESCSGNCEWYIWRELEQMLPSLKRDEE
jgi:hypothetical protein